MKKYISKACVILIGVLFFSGATKAADAPALKSGDLVGVIGDSITEQLAYSAYIEEYLLVCKPAPDLHAMQFGWGGERSPEFARRMQNDMIPFGCTVATTCYGMNDGGYGPLTDAKSKAYIDGEKSMIDQLKQANVRFIVLGSPGCVDSVTYKDGPRKAVVYNKTLGQLAELDKQLAQEQGVTFADVHTPMMDVMAKAKAKYGVMYQVAGDDGVHPDANGHLIMAYAFLKALGCKGDIGTITVDLAANTAQASDGHKIVSMKDGTVTVESSKYPFCFTGDPASPKSTIGILEFLPFNDELNRYMLIVNNATTDRVKITWGTSSKEFSATDLKKGINLAAEFMDNPFSKPFADVKAVIAKQQKRETIIIHGQLHDLGFPPKAASRPADPEARDAIIKEDKSLRDEATAAVVPVTHTITIEPVK